MNKLIIKISCFLSISFGILCTTTNICPRVETLFESNQIVSFEKKSFMQNANYLIDSNYINEWDFTAVIDSIEYYRGLYPEKSDNEIADLVYESLFVRQRYVGGLTPAEFHVIMNALGLKGFFTVRDIANEVTNVTVEKYGINGYQDDSDAFRHIYLTCVLYDRISRKFAIDLMTAHESETEDGIDKEMDLHNNSRGISLYEKWVGMNKFGLLKDFITHCVYNGHFYNIKKIKTFNGISELVYTENGLDNSEYANKSIVNLTSYSKNSSMTKNDFQWYKFNSGNKTGTFNVYSTGEVDLKVELYSTRTKESIIVDSDDDDGDGLNFSLNFDLTYYETIYIKVRGYADNKIGDYQINISEINVTQAPTINYLKFNKKFHIRVDASGTRTQEPHVVSSSTGRYTNCLLCGESLDTINDGPFFVMFSLNNNQSINRITTFNYSHVHLTKQEWEKYVEGTYFDKEQVV